MEGNRLVKLMEPNLAADTIDAGGQVMPGAPIRHDWWVTRFDQSGREGITAEAEVGQRFTRYRGRVYGAIERCTSAWQLQDETGNVLDVEDVLLEQGPDEAGWFNVLCLRLT